MAAEQGSHAAQSALTSVVTLAWRRFHEVRMWKAGQGVEPERAPGCAAEIALHHR